jgi:hypothetical protein
MTSFLFSLLTGIPGFLNGLLAYLNKRQDTAVAENTNSKDVAISIIQAEVSRQSSLRDISVSAMSHPIWWVAWSLGVFPVLTYHACIFWVSIFPGLGWPILHVPQDQAEFGRMVVQWMFGISGASALVTSVASSWSKRA